DFQISSVLRRAWTFREIVLDAPSTLVALRADGSLNWLDFIRDFAGEQPAPEPEPDSAPPRLLVDRLAVTRGMADFSDRKFADDFETRVSPIDFEVRELSTLPDETGNHRLQLRTEIGARLQREGTLGLNPLVASGAVALSDLVFERIWPYLEARLAIAPPRGTGEVRFNYRLGYEGGGLSMLLDDIAATVNGLAIAGTEEAEPGIRIDTIALAGGQFDLQAQSARVESLDIKGGRIAARRGSDGAIDIASWFSSPDEERAVGEDTPTDASAQAPAPAQAPAASPAPSNSISGTITPGTTAANPDDATWRFGVGRVGVDEIALHYIDEGFARPLTIAVDELRIGFGLGGASGGDGPQAKLEGLGVELSGLSFTAEGIEDPLLTLAGAKLEGGGFDLAERSMAVDAIRLGGAKLAAARGAD